MQLLNNLCIMRSGSDLEMVFKYPRPLVLWVTPPAGYYLLKIRIAGKIH